MATKRSFLSIFASIGHAIEAAAKIAAPIIATVDPPIGALITMAANAAVGAESAITAPGSGAQRAAAVSAQMQAVIDVANAILASQGKPPLPATTAGVVMQQVGVVVSGLNTAALIAPPIPDVAPIAKTATASF